MVVLSQISLTKTQLLLTKGVLFRVAWLNKDALLNGPMSWGFCQCKYKNSLILVNCFIYGSPPLLNSKKYFKIEYQAIVMAQRSLSTGRTECCLDFVQDKDLLWYVLI